MGTLCLRKHEVSLQVDNAHIWQRTGKNESVSLLYCETIGDIVRYREISFLETFPSTKGASASSNGLGRGSNTEDTYAKVEANEFIRVSFLIPKPKHIAVEGQS